MHVPRRKNKRRAELCDVMHRYGLRDVQAKRSLKNVFEGELYGSPFFIKKSLKECSVVKRGCDFSAVIADLKLKIFTSFALFH